MSAVYAAETSALSARALQIVSFVVLNHVLNLELVTRQPVLFESLAGTIRVVLYASENSRAFFPIIIQKVLILLFPSLNASVVFNRKSTAILVFRI